MPDEVEVEIFDQAIKWFWDFGIKRKAPYSLSPARWLDTVSRSRHKIQQLSGFEKNPSQKGCAAVWGPSQSGKSTLLSGYIDRLADLVGNGSALHWEGGSPARFVVPSDAPDGLLSLNPYNYGADGSACVSRFVSVGDEQIKDPKHPVEIRLAKTWEIMTSLAGGYVSECNSANELGEEFSFNFEGFTNKLKGVSAGGAPTREAFEFLQTLANILEILIQSGSKRFINLRGRWSALRQHMLETPGLLADTKAVMQFAYDVLWDSQLALNTTFDDLARKSLSFQKLWAGKRIFCSLEAAALLLDMDSYVSLVMPGRRDASNTNRVGRIRDAIDQWTWKEDGDRVLIGTGFKNKVISADYDYGLLQALVWELVIPLRASVLKQVSPVFHEFLQSADLLDFPGVALAAENARQSLMDVKKLEVEDKHKLLTEVFKRGKTASIVSIYSKNLNIDAFAVLTRAGRYPAKPEQLISGIVTWWCAFDPTFNPDDERPNPPLPLNLVLTFFGSVVSDVIRNPNGPELHRIFKTMIGDKLQILGRPSVITPYATTYKHFRDGEVIGTPEQVEAARERIKQDVSFAEYFDTGEKVANFDRMFGADGGTDCLFDNLRRQIMGSNRRNLLRKQKIACINDLMNMMQQAMPDSSPEHSERNQAFASMIEAIERALRRLEVEDQEPDSAMRVASVLRRFLDVDPEILDPIPRLVRNSSLNVGKYIREQFLKWVSRPLNSNDLALLGFHSPTEAVKVLHHLSESVDIKAVSDWFMKELGNIDGVETSRVYRRYLAVTMSNAVLCGPKPAPEHHGFIPAPKARPLMGGKLPPTPAILESLRRFAKFESGAQSTTTKRHRYEDSPHFAGFIETVYEAFSRIMDEGNSTRPQQAGDSELTALFNNLAEMKLA